MILRIAVIAVLLASCHRKEFYYDCTIVNRENNDTFPFMLSFYKQYNRGDTFAYPGNERFYVIIREQLPRRRLQNEVFYNELNPREKAKIDWLRKNNPYYDSIEWYNVWYFNLDSGQKIDERHTTTFLSLTQ